MPYGISANQSDCSNWAAVKIEADGSATTLECYPTKQDAIDRMVAQSLAEGLEPAGEVGQRKMDKRNDEMVAFIDSAIMILMQAKASYESDEEMEDELEDELEDQPIEQMQMQEYRAVNLSAPAFMRASAKRGLALHAEGESGDGLVPATVADARRMANGEALSENKWRKISPWIARHIVDLDAVQGDEITAGLVAMLLWGGGSSKSSARRAQAYAERIVEQLDGDEERAPAPPKDQIKGSDENPQGSAADKTGGIKLSEGTEKTLQNKVTEHNDKMKEADRPDWTLVTLGALKAVYRRGSGAFSTSHRPNMTRAQWSFARVNAFLYLSRTGAPENKNYVQDNDLLKSNHPRFSQSKKDN
jgi:hypothetical protein